MKTKTLLAGLGLCLLAACSTSKEELIVDKELDYCNRQVHRTLDIMRGKGDKIDYTMMPRNILDGQYDWNYRKATKDEWCSGFWPGILWYDYEYTGDEKIKEEAEKFTASLKFLSEIPAFDHDLGFLVFCSYGNGYRLTHNPEYKQVILNTAALKLVGFPVGGLRLPLIEATPEQSARLAEVMRACAPVE